MNSPDATATTLAGGGTSVVTARWPKEIGAGVVAAIVTVAPILTLGVLAYAALGRDAAAIGIPAAFASVAVGGAVLALFGRSAVPAAGLSSATVVIFASLTAQLYADLGALPLAAATATLVAGMAATVFLMGLLQIVFGAARLGSLAKFVPHPVLAGFMNGVALLILLAQVPLLLGVVARDWAVGTVRWSDVQPATLAIAALTIATVWLVAWRAPRAPSVLIGLVAGCLAYVGCGLLWPGLALGPLTGALPHAMPLPDAWRPLADEEGAALTALARHWPAIASTALLLAIIGSLESILGGLATDHDAGHRHDANRELLVFGGANMLAGLFGALPVVHWRSRALAIGQSGGRSRRAVLSAALATALLFVVFGGLMALLPLAVLAAIMVTVGVGLFDRWTLRLVAQVLRGDRERVLLLNLAVVVLVFAITLWPGFLAAVGVGLLASMALFIVAMNRSLVRERFDAGVRPSRRLYPARQEELLTPRRRRIEVMVLEGALFFGSVDRLASEAERLAGDTAFLVLDLRRVTTIDASGAVALRQLGESLARRGIALLLAGVDAENAHGLALRAAGAVSGTSSGDWFADLDLATEAAEVRLLAGSDVCAGESEAWCRALDGTSRSEREARSRALDDASTGESETRLADSDLLAGLHAEQVDAVIARLVRHEVPAGSTLFRAGDAGSSLFVLGSGSISIVALDAKGRAAQRYVSFSPGMMFGETAMLDGKGRSAAACADRDSIVHELHHADIDALGAADSALAAGLYRNIATHLSERLRYSAGAWNAAKG